MACSVAGLVFYDGAGESEYAPVGEAPDYARGAEDEGSCCAGDSVGGE